MKIEYVCHSCLYIDTGDTTIAFDPWYNGSAYYNQWHVFPKPVNTGMLESVKNILITHGHEDHLHENTLKLLPKDARVFYPYQWRNGIESFFGTIGFNNLTEAVSFKEYQVSPTTKITYIGFALESLVVIECNDKVIVNLNDALNSHHQNVVEMFLREIIKRWPKIDYLFSGWSGAGYFPNTVHYKTKNDYEIGQIREQYFANHFCKIVKRLNPKVAIPFAPGFVLLSPDKRWINEVKFPREVLAGYYKEHYDPDNKIDFKVIYPGDYFLDDQFHKTSPCYAQMVDGSLNHTVDQVYAKEIEQSKIVEYIDERDVEVLTGKMDKYLNENARLFDEVVLKDARFAVRLNDLKKNSFFNISYTSNRFNVSRSNGFLEDNKLLIRTNSKLLNFSLDSEWGGDALTIGYGIDVDVFEESTLEKNLDIVCVRLLTRYPTASENLVKHPFRAMKYFITNPLLSQLAIKQKFLMRSQVNKFPYNERDHWVSYSKCDLCKVCDMPLLSFEFGEQLGVAS